MTIEEGDREGMAANRMPMEKGTVRFRTKLELCSQRSILSTPLLPSQVLHITQYSPVCFFDRTTLNVGIKSSR